MKVVIDIAENIKKQINDGKGETELGIPLWLAYSISKGTPLPKGHGRLGDLDALEKEIVNGIKAGNYEEGYETFAHINDMEYCVECVKYADTIIEADKDGE